MNPPDADTTPWYRVPVVWLALAPPLLAVVLGVVLIVLAVASDDGLVVDDYYRRGKEINLDIKRDRAAAARGLNARVVLRNETARVRIEGTFDAASLNAQLRHATRAGFDQTLTLVRDAGGEYRAALPPLAPGHWYVELSAEDWRLTGSLFLPTDNEVDLVPTVPSP